MHGASLVLNSPAPQEVSIVYDEPWEGNISGYETVLYDGGLYRMYYRGSHHPYGDNDDLGFQVTCYAESTDGIYWKKPSLGLVDFKGSKDNNIIWEGVVSHNLSSVIDRNPACAPDAKFKAREALAGNTGSTPSSPPMASAGR